LGFALETREHLRIFGHIIRQEFQGDEAMQAGIFGFVDNAHATAAKAIDNLVVRKSLADERVGGGHFGHIRVRVGSKSTNAKTVVTQRVLQIQEKEHR
jgi:hypothetical protein